MAIVNFAIPRTLERKVDQVIREDGFMSKAEFFRFAVLSYINWRQNDITQEEYEESVKDLKQAMQEKLKEKKLPSLEEQLANI